MAEPERRIPAPTGRRQPLKANIFELAKSGCSQLLPVFPYLGPDAVVPAVGVEWGEEGRSVGRFFHQNSVDEVGICFGAIDMPGAMTGGVFCTGRTHPVGRTDDEPEPPVGSSMVMTITQRQGTAEQQESFMVRCEKCQHLMHRHRFAAAPTDPAGGELEAFLTLVECANGADEFNQSEERRTCAKCGHVNPRFPLDAWGWELYRSRAQLAEAARRALTEAGARLTPAEEPA